MFFEFRRLFCVENAKIERKPRCLASIDLTKLSRRVIDVAVRLHRISFALILIALLPAVASLPVFAGPRDTGVDTILDSAESLFKAMKARDYKGIWGRLSGSSRTYIVNAALKAITESSSAAGSEAKYSREMLEDDFRAGGTISKAYWDGYLQNFNPDLLLEESKWEMGKIEKNRAEVMVRYRKGEGPVLLQMVNEDGRWKVGLVETFRSSTR